MKTEQTNKTEQGEEMTKFEEIQERVLSTAEETILKATRHLKEPYQRQVLQRALESIGPESPDSEEIGQEVQEPESKKLGPEDRTQAVVKQWLLERDFTTRLAVILLAEYMVADHGTEELAGEIMSKYEDDILAVAKDLEKHPDGISVKEIFLSGVVAESLLTNQLR